MSSKAAPITIVALGVYRHVAATLSTPFLNTPYQLAAILDLMSQPVAFTYSAHNLGVVLHTLEPRPKVLITGLAIQQDMTREAIEVFDKYAKVLEVPGTLVINVRYARHNWNIFLA